MVKYCECCIERPNNEPYFPGDGKLGVAARWLIQGKPNSRGKYEELKADVCGKCAYEISEENIISIVKLNRRMNWK
jgi:hypothetical protein